MKATGSRDEGQVLHSPGCFAPPGRRLVLHLQHAPRLQHPLEARVPKPLSMSTLLPPLMSLPPPLQPEGGGHRGWP